MNAANFSNWLVLSHPDCSLCEAMLAELCDLLGEAAATIRVVDISDHPEWERQYGQRIPVLLIDDDFVCAYRLDRNRLQGYLAIKPPVATG